MVSSGVGGGDGKLVVVESSCGHGWAGYLGFVAACGLGWAVGVAGRRPKGGIGEVRRLGGVVMRRLVSSLERTVAMAVAVVCSDCSGRFNFQLGRPELSRSHEQVLFFF
jgi:hypothetical protein